MAELGGNLDVKNNVDGVANLNLESARQKRERQDFREQLEAKAKLDEKTYNATKVVLGIAGYSPEEIEKFFEDDSVSVVQLMDAISDVIKNSVTELGISKPDPSDLYLSLEFSNNKRVAGLSRGEGVPLFNANGVSFFSKEVNDIVLALNGGFPVAPKNVSEQKNDKFEDFVQQNRNKKIVGRSNIKAFGQLCDDNHPYSLAAVDLAYLHVKNSEYTDEQLKGFIDKGVKILPYMSRYIEDNKTGDKMFSDKVSVFLDLLGSTLNDINSGRVVDKSLLNEIENKQIEVAIGFVRDWRPDYLDQEEMNSDVIIEHTNRVNYNLVIWGMSKCLQELIRRN